MTRLRSLTFGLTLAVAAALAGCADSMPIAPSSDGPAFSRGHGHDNGGKSRLKVLKQDENRRNAASVKETVGAAGGTLSAGGVKLEIPAGALDSDVEITMTVPKGSYLEVRFQPHGLEFAKAATLTMNVKGALPESADEAVIEATGKILKEIQSGLQGVYFEGTLGEDAVAKEILDATVDGDRASFDIRHFSGYCVAVG